VFWSNAAEARLSSLKPDITLKEQVYPESFSHPLSPNWQDHSTTSECNFIEEKIGGSEALANITGSKAHHVIPSVAKILTASALQDLKF